MSALNFPMKGPRMKKTAKIFMTFTLVAAIISHLRHIRRPSVRAVLHNAL
jgi:hypothetical protein